MCVCAPPPTDAWTFRYSLDEYEDDDEDEDEVEDGDGDGDGEYFIYQYKILYLSQHYIIFVLTVYCICLKWILYLS